MQDTTISDWRKNKLLKGYPCDTEQESAQLIATLLCFAMERIFVRRTAANTMLMATGSLSPASADYILNNHVLTPCRHFCGREEELSVLHDLLNDHSKVFISSIPGIGKSELAKAYAKQHKADYTNIVHLYYTGSLREDITRMDSVDDLPDDTDEVRYQRHARFLRTLKEDTLLIVDNFNVTVGEDDLLAEIMAASEARIDHRSNAERGIDEHPPVHEGIAARMIEKRGGTSVLCEMNRQIRADNDLLRALKEQVQKLMGAVKQGVPALLEAFRDGLVLVQYQLLFNDGQQASLSERLQAIRNLTTEYKTIQTAIKGKTAQRKALLAEQAELSPLQFIRSSQISQEVAALTEDIEELRFRKEQLLASVPDGDTKSVARQEKDLSASMSKLEEQYAHLSAQKDNAHVDYIATLAEVDAAGLTAVQAQRDAIRAEHRESITQRLKGTYGKHYRPELLRKAERFIDTELGEQPAAEERRSLREQLNTHKQTQEHHPDKKEHDHARGR